MGCEAKKSPVATPPSATSESSSAAATETAPPKEATSSATAPSPAADQQASPALDAAGAKVTRDAKGSITAVDLRGCKVEEAVQEEVAKLANLQQLDLRECAVSNDQLARMVKPLSKLKALRLSGKGAVTTVDDDGIAALAACSDLRVLAVDELWFSDKGLKHLSGCKNLSELYAAGTLLDDAAMTVLEEFKQLKKLRLAKTSVSAKGLAALTDLKLEELDLSECASSIEDAAMEPLSKFTTLKRLNLWRDPVSDSVSQSSRA